MHIILYADILYSDMLCRHIIQTYYMQTYCTDIEVNLVFVSIRLRNMFAVKDYISLSIKSRVV